MEESEKRCSSDSENRFADSFTLARSFILNPIGTYPERDDYIAEIWSGNQREK